MNRLSQICNQLKKDFTPRIKDPTKPVSCWSEKDILNDKKVDTFVIILRTKGCSWAQESGCSMCGYFNDSLWSDVTHEDISKQIDKIHEKYSQEKFIKIFTSGSFLDDSEISKKTRKKIITDLYENAEKISVESRPEYITEEKLLEIKKISKNKDFEIGIGLETANDTIREKCINKGFTFNDYKKAAEKIKKNNMGLKTYILIKPPFISEKKAIEDSIETVEKIKNITDIVSFNPTNIQRHTLVEFLWKRKQYRAPWLWSIVNILEKSKKNSDIFIKCDISGGGNIRGPHNCHSCDRSFLNAISDFSLNQNSSVFKNLSCECKEKWLDQLDLEEISFGSLIDIN